MFEDVSILIPYKSDNGIRDINLNWIKNYYEKIFPDVEICVGVSTDEHFNRSRAINLAAKQATRDIFVIADGDIFFDPDVIKDSIKHIEKFSWVIPFRKIVRISEVNSRNLVEAEPTWPLEITDFEIDYAPDTNYLGGLNIITREHFMAVGGFDERFMGWGGEDDAFSCAVNTLCGLAIRLEHTIYHLWHPVVGSWNNPNYYDNLEILKLYYQANNDKEKMKQVLSGTETIFKDRKKTLFENVSILIPYKPDNGMRDINFKWIKSYYEQIFPDCEICVGLNTDELFNKAKAINLAAQQATRDIFVIMDADIFCEPDVIKESIENLEKAPLVIPYTKIVRISERNTRSLLESDPTWPLEVTDFQIEYTSDFTGGINIITRDNFMAVGGYDERFSGWGGEDDSFYYAVTTICGKYKRLEHTIYHLWHPFIGYEKNPNSVNNLRIRELYEQASNDKEKMKQVLSGAKTIFKDKLKRTNRRDAIHIVTVSNDLYAKHLAVMLNSLLKNKKSTNPVKIYVIDSNISVENKLLLAKTTRKYKAKIYFKQIDTNLYRDFPTLAYVINEAYYRISIPDLFNKIDKVLYLDCDIIVKSDITELWNKDISQYYIGAVEDPYVRDTRNSDLMISDNSKYFNSGVLLINLKKWRENDIKNKIIEFVKSYFSKIKYCDQDALNAVLYDQWLSLDPKWNIQSAHLLDPSLKINPAIIHYTGYDKPWNSDHPLKEHYFMYKDSNYS